MASTHLAHLGTMELKRVAAMVGVMESAVNVAGFTPDMLKAEGSNGELRRSYIWLKGGA